MKFLLILTAMCISCLTPLDGYKILVLPSALESHRVYFTRFGEELVNQGHKVTFLVGDKMSKVQDYKESGFEVRTFHMENASQLDNPETQSLVHQFAFSSSLMERWGLAKAGLKLFEEEAMLIFKDNKTIEKLQKEKYDFALVDLPHAMLLPYKLSLPYGIIGQDAPHFIRRIPYLPSYVPMSTSDHSDQMNLGERFFNFLQFTLFDLIITYMHGGTLLSQQVAPELPPVSVADLYHKASLFFKFPDFGFETPRPGMPDIIPVGHIFVRPPKNLPADICDILDESKSTILVSSDSMARNFPEEIVSQLVQVFSNVDYDVILKNDREISATIPENVHVLKSIPQNDILAHKNLKLFVSDCGFSSIMEAIYHGVPMLCLPMGLDQRSTAAFVKSRGYGEIMDITKFTKAELMSNVEDITTDQTYADNLRKTGEIIRDMQENQISNPTFWINHVIKFGDAHLRTQAYNMPLYQYLMLDVIGLLIFFAFAILVVLYPVMKQLHVMYRWSCFEYKDIGIIN